MTAKDIFELRKQGLSEEAYDAAKQLYSQDKGPFASLAMFWTAVDILWARFAKGRMEEAMKILMALERMLPRVPDTDGQVHHAFIRCQKLLQGPEHIQMGIWGEEVAADYLRNKGYTILERNWHSKHRDIDIIAHNSESIVFVEVKTRRNTNYGSPDMAVNYKKQKNLLYAINHYIKYRHIDIPVQFDIITVVGPLGDSNPIITHFENIDIMRASIH